MLYFVASLVLKDLCLHLHSSSRSRDDASWSGAWRWEVHRSVGVGATSEVAPPEDCTNPQRPQSTSTCSRPKPWAQAGTSGRRETWNVHQISLLDGVGDRMHQHSKYIVWDAFLGAPSSKEHLNSLVAVQSLLASWMLFHLSNSQFKTVGRLLEDQYGFFKSTHWTCLEIESSTEWDYCACKDQEKGTLVTTMFFVVKAVTIRQSLRKKGSMFFQDWIKLPCSEMGDSLPCYSKKDKQWENMGNLCFTWIWDDLQCVQFIFETNPSSFGRNCFNYR